MCLQGENAVKKISDIARFISQQIAQLCQCQYSGSFIVDGQLFCTTKNNVIYQAKLLSTDGKTALEIRNITQLWVLSKPIVTIEEKFYQLDPFCSVVVKELGVTSCDSVSSTESLSELQSFTTIELASVIGTGVMLLLVIVLIVALVCCCVCKKKSKHYDVR